ncbi:bifunctional 2-polyprenyl-6-hydroxyphenol methylase/3-demethylubiquinol 3-O-methyltransferase UbiG [Roseomonas elaeocarpi]|uniref:Ubiquinone biosynthesis O-methyltransferase n=1 Tax=Roseomonas elaeocarpi TaxID=907779 RepID=A0ABV6JUU4_9PROT
MSGTARPDEIRKFDALAARWWDPRGPMAPLHAMNPLRCGWIAERLAPGGDLSGLRILDVGCGAGLAAEALARRGAEVTAIDASVEALAVARQHAEGSGLPIDYRCAPPEALEGEWDAVVSLEVVEHVDHRPDFLRALAARTRPGGAVFLSTLNRTPRSFVMAKLGAEYVFRLLARGTHDWRKFVSPAELGAELRQVGLRVTDIAGMSFSPIERRWKATRDVGINYILMARRD